MTVPSTDISRGIQFYLKLGLHLIVDSTPKYARFEVPDDKQTLSLEKVSNTANGIGVTVYFECEDVDQKVAQLKKMGILFEEELHDQPWKWREARLRDPDGNRICFYHAGKMRRFPPWRVTEPEGEKG